MSDKNDNVEELLRKKVKLEFRWHGIKRLPANEGFRTLPKADLYLDCRGVAEKGIQGWSGKDPKFQAAIEKLSPVTLCAFEDIILDSLRQLHHRRGEMSKTFDPYAQPYVVLFLCAHGVHRSVSSCHVIAARLLLDGYNVTVTESPLPTQVVAKANEGRLHRTGAKE